MTYTDKRPLIRTQCGICGTTCGRRECLYAHTVRHHTGMGDVLLKRKYQAIIFSEDAAEQSAALKAQLERRCVRACAEIMQEARRRAVNKVRALRGVYAKEAEALEAVHDVLKRFEAKQNCAELNSLRDVRQRHKEAQQRWSAKQRMIRREEQFSDA